MKLMHNSFASNDFQHLAMFRDAVTRDVPNWQMTPLIDLGCCDETWFERWKEQLEKASGVFVIMSDAYSQKVSRGPDSPLHKEAVAIRRRRNDDPTFKVFVFNPSKAGQGPNDLVMYLHRDVGDMNFVGWQKWLQQLQRTHPKPEAALRTALNLCAKRLLIDADDSTIDAVVDCVISFLMRMIPPEGNVPWYFGKMKSWWDANFRAANVRAVKPLVVVSPALLYKSTVMGIFSETGTMRLDIGGKCMKKDCPANHESWATQLVFKRLDGKSSGHVLPDHVFGIFTKDGDGAKRLDIGAGSLKKECPASHNSWATRFVVRRLDVADEGPICYGHTVGIFSEGGKVRLDIGSQCVTKERPGNHDSPTSRLRVKVLPPEARL